MNKCKINPDNTLNFCKAMETELLKSNGGPDPRLFQLVCINRKNEAILLIHIQTVINFCPFCGGEVKTDD